MCKIEGECKSGQKHWRRKKRFSSCKFGYIFVAIVSVRVITSIESHSCAQTIYQYAYASFDRKIKPHQLNECTCWKIESLSKCCGCLILCERYHVRFIDFCFFWQSVRHFFLRRIQWKERVGRAEPPAQFLILGWIWVDLSNTHTQNWHCIRSGHLHECKHSTIVVASIR